MPALRSGRGVTTSDSLKGRGPRCGSCGEFVAIVARNANGTLVCPDCGPEKLFSGLVVPIEGPDEPVVRTKRRG